MKELRLVKVLKYFFENPYQEVYLRDLSRKLKLSPFAVKKYSDFLIKAGLIKDEKKANLRYFKANIYSLLFKHLKIAWNIDKIVKSGLIKTITNKSQSVSSIVLFGSVAKGEDTKESDIDLVVIGSKKYIDVSEVELKLKKTINLHTFSWAEWKKQTKSNAAFYSDVIMYGIPLYGELPLVR